MSRASNAGIFVMIIATGTLLGCATPAPPAGESEPTEADSGEEGFTEENGDEEVDQTQGALEGTEQAVFRSTSNKCWTALKVGNRYLLRLRNCVEGAPKQLWYLDGWLLRNAHYWGRCVQIHPALNHELVLPNCDPNQSYQWFLDVTASGDQGLICGFVQGPSAEPRCATHYGGAAIYTATPDQASPWYRD